MQHNVIFTANIGNIKMNNQKYQNKWMLKIENNIIQEGKQA